MTGRVGVRGHIAVAVVMVVLGGLIGGAVPAHAAERAECDGERATLVGTSRNDRLVGTAGRDVIDAGGGDDVVVGKGGDDIVCGRGGKDALSGGDGADRLIGGGSADELAGGDGADVLSGGDAGDSLRGGSGRDRLYGGGGHDTAHGGANRDRCEAEDLTSCNEPPPNQAPVANPDTFTVVEDGRLVSRDPGILANDSDADTDTLRAVLVAQPEHGSIVLDHDGWFAYEPEADFNGTDTFRYVASDGVLRSDPATVTITVLPANDPVTGVTLDGTSVPENSPAGTKVGTLAAADIDLDDTATFTLVPGPGDTDNGRFAVSGSTLAIAAPVDAEANRQFSVRVRAADGSTFTEAAFVVDVVNVNEAPMIEAPAQATTEEDGALTFSALGGNAVTVSDVDAGTDDVEIELSVDHGTLTLGDTTALVFTTGDGADDAALTFSASTAEANAALEGLIYTPAGDFAMTDTLAIAVNDNGYTGAGGALSDTHSVALTVNPVNDAPVNTVPGRQSVVEDATLQLTGALSVADVDAGDGKVTLTVGNGTLTLADTTGLTFVEGTANGGDDLRFTGTLAALNAALGDVAYSPADGFTDTDTLTLLFSDLGNTGSGGAKTDSDPVLIDVAALNVAPQNSVPLGQVANEDTVLTFTQAKDNGVSVTDADAGAEDIQLTLAAGDGTLTLGTASGLLFDCDSCAGDGIADASMTFEGSLTEVNAALAGLAYRPRTDFNGGDVITMTTDDLGNNGAGGNRTDSDTIDVTVAAVNDEPVNGVPGAQTVAEDAALTLSAATENALTISDVDAGTSALTVDLSVVQGTVAAGLPSGGTRTGNATADLQLTGTVAAINTALNSLVYTPTANYSGSDSIEIVTSDHGNTGAGGTLTDTDSLAILVDAAGDAPRFTTATEPGALAYVEGEGAKDLFPTLTLDDADGGNLSSATVELSTNYVAGQDVLAFVNQNGVTGNFDSATGTLTLSGMRPLADYQTALRAVRYDNVNDAPSTATRTATFTIKDPTGLTGATTRDVTVAATNDAPVLTLSTSTPEYVEQSAATPVDSGLTLADADDADLESATVTLTTGAQTADVLSFDPGSSGITDSSTDDNVLILTKTGGATKAAWEAVLQTVTFANPNDVPGSSRMVAFTVNDGDLDSAVANKTISVVDTPDRPVVSTGDSLAYAENEAAKVVDSTITVVDDGTVASAQISVSAGHQTADDLSWVDNDTTDAIALSSDLDATDVLTLTGAGTLVQYEAALEAVKFAHVGENPSTSKTIAFKAADSDGYGEDATVAVSVTPSNDAPVVVSDGTLAYTENDDASPVDQNMTLVDPEAHTITTASVTISANYSAGQDALAWTDNNPADDIMLDDGSTSETLVLTGTATASEYQAALRAVTYANSSDSPSTAGRTVTFSATDVAGAAGTDTRAISVAAVDNPPAAFDDTATVAEDAAATAVPVLANDTDVDAGPKVISRVEQPANGTVVLTGGSAGSHTGLTYQPAADYCNNQPAGAGDTFTYTINGGSSATVSMTVTCADDAPVADDETFDGNQSAVGNTAMVVDDPSDAAPAATYPKTTVSGDILDGDHDVDGPGPVTIVPGTVATNDGGTVDLSADGDFIFHPAATVSCTDRSDYFDYTLQDADASTDLTDTGRVTIATAGCVWYVDNAGDGNGGTSSKPFDTLAQAEAASGPGDTVFVFKGDGTAYDAAGYTMNAGERLIGEHAGLVVDADGAGSRNPDTLHPPRAGFFPTVVASGADVVGLDDDNEIRGLTLDAHGSSSAIAGGAGDVGGTIGDVNILDTLGTPAVLPGLELIGTSGTFTISNLTVNNSTTGMLLDNAGAVNLVDAGTISIVSTGGQALKSQGTALTGTVDTARVTGSGAGGVQITNNGGGTVTFGELSLSTSGPTPSLWLNNPGAVNVAGGSPTVRNSSGPAVTVVSGSGVALAFSSVESAASPTHGVSLTDMGAGTFSSPAGSISGHSGTAVVVSGGNGAISYGGTLGDGAGATASITNRTGGTVAFAGAINDLADTGGGISLSGNSGGSTTFTNAAKRLNTGTGDGVAMTSSDGHTLTFVNGGLDIDTTSGRGFSATSSGTVAVRGSGNTIDSAGGQALNVTATDIAPEGLTFQRISSNGAATGMTLDGTGSAGFVTITGDGTTDSGGIINGAPGDGIRLKDTRDISLSRMKVTNAAGSVTGATCTSQTAADCSAAIDMNGVTNITLSNVAVNASGQQGISGNNVNGLTITNSTVNNAGNGNDEFGMLFSQLSGTVLIQDTTIDNPEESALRLYNSAGALRMTVRRVTMQNNDTVTGEDGLQLEIEGTAVATVLVDGSTLQELDRDGVDGIVEGAGVLNLTVANSILRNNEGAGITLAANDTATLRTSLANNQITNVTGTGVNVVGAVNSVVHATVTANAITSPAVTNSGFGIRLSQEEDGDYTANVQNNTIANTGYSGLRVLSRLGELNTSAGTASTNFGTMHTTVRNNQVGVSRLADISMDFLVTGVENSACGDIAANTAGSYVDPLAGPLPALRARATSGAVFTLEGMPAGTQTATNAQSHLQTINPNALPVAASGSFSGGSATACRDAAMPETP